MATVYVSFGQQDAVFVRLLIQQIEAAEGYIASFSESRLIGDNPWSAGTDAELIASDVVVSVMSPQARSSDYATYEWVTAKALKKPIIVLHIRSGAIHPQLSSYPAIDFTKGPAWDDLLSEIQKVTNSAADIEQIVPVATSLPELESTSDTPESLAARTQLSPDAPVTIREAYEALDSFEPTERVTAIETLAAADHPSAADALTLAIQHPDRDIRWAAVKALASKEDRRSLPGLLEIMSSRNEQDTWDAAWSIVRIGGVESVDGILAEMRKETSFAIRSGTWALGQLGIRIKDKIIEIMDDPDINIRLAAVEVLTEIGTAILPDMINQLGSDSEERRDSAVRVLRNFEPEAIPLLTDALQQEGEVRRTAGRTLIAIGDPAVPSVAPLLRNESARMQRGAEQILRNIGTDLAREELEIWREEQAE